MRNWFCLGSVWAHLRLSNIRYPHFLWNAASGENKYNFFHFFCSERRTCIEVDAQIDLTTMPCRAAIQDNNHNLHDVAHLSTLRILARCPPFVECFLLVLATPSPLTFNTFSLPPTPLDVVGFGISCFASYSTRSTFYLLPVPTLIHNKLTAFIIRLVCCCIFPTQTAAKKMMNYDVFVVHRRCVQCGVFRICIQSHFVLVSRRR